MTMTRITKSTDRRNKARFPIHRELKYKLLRDTSVIETGTGQTTDIGSGGVSFAVGQHQMDTDCYIELSISWPVLLDDTCPMRLVVFGRLLRSKNGRCACTIDKYEFRTQSRVIHAAPRRTDSTLKRWAEALRKDAMMKSRAAMAV